MSRVREIHVEAHGVEFNLRFDFNAAARFYDLTGMEVTDDSIWVKDEEGKKDLVLTLKQQRALLFAMDAAHYEAMDPPQEPMHSLTKVGSVMTMDSIGPLTVALVQALLGVDPNRIDMEGVEDGDEANPQLAPAEEPQGV